MKKYRFALIRLFSLSIVSLLNVLVSVSVSLFPLLFIRSSIFLILSSFSFKFSKSKISKSNLFYISLSSLCYLSISIFYFLGLKYLVPEVTSLLDFGLTAIFGVLFSFLIFKNVKRVQWISVIFVILSLFFALSSVSNLSYLGLFFLVMSSLFNNIDGLIALKLKNVETQVFLFYKYLIYIVYLLIIFCFHFSLFDFSSLSVSSFLMLLIVSLLGFISNYALYKSYSDVGLASTNLVLSFTPVFSTILISLFFINKIPFLILISLIFLSIASLLEIYNPKSKLLNNK